MRGRRTVADVGELGFLRALYAPGAERRRGVVCGPGDDCAVVEAGERRLLLTTDVLVEDVHFRDGWMSPRQLGRRAYLVNASDIAAMGGVPRFCLVSLGVPAALPYARLRDMQSGIAAAAEESGARVVGGNLSRSERIFLSISLIGECVAGPVLRSGARPGDDLWVSGTLGDAALGRRKLAGSPRARGAAIRRFREPPARIRLGPALARAGVATAMIDLSDGLRTDLAHVCTASGVGAEIELTALPCRPEVRRTDIELALSGGEDYELLVSIPPRHATRAARVAARCGVRLTRIGACRASGYDIRMIGEQPRSRAPRAGFDHFAGGKRT